MLDAGAFGPTPQLAGGLVDLAPLGPDYLDPYLAMLADPEGDLLTGSGGRPFDRKTIVDWLTGRAEQTDRADFAILAQGEFVGEVVLNEFDAAAASANFRIALGGSAVYGRGFGTAATAMVLDYGFGTVGLHRIHLEVFDFNPRARRSYEKAGFRQEGVLRQAHHDADGWHDVIVMAILADDPH